MFLDRGNGPEESYHSWRWSPIATEDGSNGGVSKSTSTRRLLLLPFPDLPLPNPPSSSSSTRPRRPRQFSGNALFSLSEISPFELVSLSPSSTSRSSSDPSFPLSASSRSIGEFSEGILRALEQNSSDFSFAYLYHAKNLGSCSTLPSSTHLRSSC